MDPYSVLGIDLSATDVEITRAFRRLALVHHPDRNGGSADAAARFREIKAAYDALHGRSRPRAPTRARPATDDGRTNTRGLDPAAVAQVRKRLASLDAAIRAALIEPSAANLAAVIDLTRWTRLDVDTSLAFKGHVEDLRDEHWAHKTFVTRADALETLQAFVDAPIARLDLVGMRNLRARLTGVLAVARGAHA